MKTMKKTVGKLRWRNSEKNLKMFQKNSEEFAGKFCRIFEN